jgi:hypothetical protein
MALPGPEPAAADFYRISYRNFVIVVFVVFGDLAGGYVRSEDL